MFSGIPAPVQGVTGGQGLPQGTASIEGSTGNVVITPPSNVLQLRKGAIPQSLQIYETYSSATDYIRLSVSSNTGGPFRIRTEEAGSGVARPLNLGAGNTDNWQITTAGNLNPIIDSTYFIGDGTHAMAAVYSNAFFARGAFATNVGVQVNTPGSFLYSGTGLPSNAIGNNGDFFFRIDGLAYAPPNGALYQRRAGIWTAIA
jgi:hypothetical protein